MPFSPLRTDYAAGELGVHPAAHNDADEQINYLLSDDQPQNTVFAAPAGADGAGDFRALAVGDIPDLTAAKITDFASAVAAALSAAVCKSIVGGAGNAGTPGSTTLSMGLFSSSNRAAPSEALANVKLPYACTMRYLHVTTVAAQPSSGALVITLMKNDVATAITITVNASSAQGYFEDITHSVSFNAGDTVRLQFANAATSAAPGTNWNIGVEIPLL